MAYTVIEPQATYRGYEVPSNVLIHPPGLAP